MSEQSAGSEEDESPREYDESSKEGQLLSIQSLLSLHDTDMLFPPLDGTAFFLTICKVNHSCEPNMFVRYTCVDKFGVCAEAVSMKCIAEREELVQSYVDQTLPYQERQESLADYGFICTCSLCSAQKMLIN